MIKVFDSGGTAGGLGEVQKYRLSSERVASTPTATPATSPTKRKSGSVPSARSVNQPPTRPPARHRAFNIPSPANVMMPGRGFSKLTSWG